MTILGILFVLGIAFLASMNFEADMIASETQRHRAESRVTAVVDQLGSTLRDGLMSAARTPFGDPSIALSPTAFAEMPGVQNSFSPIEPYRDDKGTAVLSDDSIRYRWFTDLEASQRRPFAGPTYPSLEIDTTVPPGTTPIPGNPVFVDADGDGIADSLQVDARVLGFSDAQLAALSARLNPPTNPTGKVFVGIRVIPHGGLVNLNASHPKLIENVLDVPDLRVTPNPADYGKFKHRPTTDQVAYSPLLEEPSLRRRGFLAPRAMPPSWLQGDPFVDPQRYPDGRADMGRQLFAPQPNGGAARGEYESVFDLPPKYYHRFSPYLPGEPFPGFPEYTSWAVRMEPTTSFKADPTVDSNGQPLLPQYDRRHLVTTVSHDDLLARGGRVVNPAVPGGEEDILTKMTQANQTARPPGGECPVLLPFEYPDYPDTILDDCCPTDLGCRLNARKGRLQLSLPFLDDQIDAANKMTDPVKRQQALDRVVRLIHDTFFLLVRNAAHVTTLEGTPCTNPNTASVECAYDKGWCGANLLCTVTIPPTPVTPFTDCRPPPPTGTPCRIPGSMCRADGVCTIQAPYWQDVPCAATPGVCLPLGEQCNTTLDRCMDPWTGQTHSQSLISRTAAALTANLIDYADADDIPTRIALRSLDLTTGLCIAPPANTGRACDVDADCGTGGLCAPPRGMCAKGANTGHACGKDADCIGGGPNSCRPPANAAGRLFDFDPAPNFCNGGSNNLEPCNSNDNCPGGTCPVSPTYVYGLERQPYITEVATYAEGPPAAHLLTGWAVELFNPYDTPINATNQYFLYWVNPGGGSSPQIVLNATLQPNSGATPNPFTVFITANNAAARDGLLGTPFSGVSHDLTAPNALTFTNGSTIYLVRRVQYPLDTNPTNIVVDQFEVPPIGNVGNADPGVPVGTYSRQRMVLANSPWTATVPMTGEIGPGPATLGTWNTFVPPLPLQPPHPVEVNFANLDWFSRPFKNPTNLNDPRNGSVSFPTTGSLLMLMRHANRSFNDRIAPDLTVVNDLAFTTRLIGETSIPNPAGGVPLVTFSAEQQIDNGRMPVFDPPVLGTDTNWYSAHHLAPNITRRGAPGNLDTLPWGQLVFDYFTALPLSNPGPYVDVEPGPEVVVASPDSKPRVDLDGLRVHGRININAAPWKVLAGLPFVPMEKIPVAFKAEMRRVLGFVKETAANSLAPAPAELDMLDTQAGRIGNELAQAIVAYRELRPLPGGVTNSTGNYDNGTPVGGTPPAPTIAYGRGWNVAAPVARRGTGFMGVGELANVRHLGAATLVPPPPPGFSKTFFRIDGGVIDPTQPNLANTQNFVDAVAALVALGDWVTVRSQVFTVYGVLRGEDDPTLVDPTPLSDPVQEQQRMQQLRAQDVDSRALRFQETIDRLPTFLGEPVPSRIGERTLTRYTDAHND